MPAFVALIPIAGMILAGFIIAMALRNERHKQELRTKERLAALEKGLDVPLLDAPEPPSSGNPLLVAFILIGLGAGLTFALNMLIPGRSPAGFGVMIALIGGAYLLHWFVGGKAEWQRRRELHEELTRAYIERLRGRSAPPSPRDDKDVA